MDDPDVAGPELEATLLEIERINDTLGGYGPSLAGLARLVEPGARTLSVLDVGTGSGCYPRKMVAWGRSRGLDVKVTGIDLFAPAAELASRRCADLPEISIEQQDLFELEATRRFDVVHAAAVLHHFPGDAAVRALARMFAHARRGVVVNDFHRHPAAWAGIRVLTAALSKSRLVRNDAPLSVLRAFSKAELEALCTKAGLPAPEIVWRPMFRWRVVIPRDDVTGDD